VSCAGISTEAMERLECQDYCVALCGCQAGDGCHGLVGDLQVCFTPGSELVRSLGIHGYACHALVNQGLTVGALAFGSRAKTTFTEDELELLILQR